MKNYLAPFIAWLRPAASPITICVAVSLSGCPDSWFATDQVATSGDSSESDDDQNSVATDPLVMPHETLLAEPSWNEEQQQRHRERTGQVQVGAWTQLLDAVQAALSVAQQQNDAEHTLVSDQIQMFYFEDPADWWGQIPDEAIPDQANGRASAPETAGFVVRVIVRNAHIATVRDRLHREPAPVITRAVECLLERANSDDATPAAQPAISHIALTGRALHDGTEYARIEFFWHAKAD